MTTKEKLQHLILTLDESDASIVYQFVLNLHAERPDDYDLQAIKEIEENPDDHAPYISANDLYKKLGLSV